MKYLSNDQRVQKMLRKSIETSLNLTRSNPSETVVPGVDAIMDTSLPYLDAVIEEMLRKAVVASGISREAKFDTQILGHHIPKGTEVFFPNMGPSFQAAPIPVDESTRSASSRERKEKFGEWDIETMEDFLPERWLVKDETGNVTYNPNAGPNLPFSAGIRGCFGKHSCVTL
jgi:cytochrome P450